MQRGSVQVQTDRWFVCAQIIREFEDGVCAEDARSCWLVLVIARSAELSREWRKEVVVMQLDVKRAFDHVDHRAAFKAMRLQSLRPFSMALIAAVWNGSCMKALGNCIVEQISDGPWIAPGRPGVSAHLHNDHGAGTKSWKMRKLARSLAVLVLAAICHADDVVLVAVSVAAAEVVVAEVIAKPKEVGLTVGAEKTLDESPEDHGHKHWSGQVGCAVGRGAGICGVEGVSRLKCKIRDCTQICSSEQVSGEMETSFGFFMGPKEVEVELFSGTRAFGRR